MKTNKILTLAFSLMALLAITSCVEDDDYSVPQSQGNEENLALNLLLSQIETGALDLVSIEEVKAMYSSDDDIPFPVDTNIVVKGYVSSSDATGNFFKEFYIQDKAENPTAGLQVITSSSDIYNKFNKGREVYIKLNGLHIGETRVGNGVITIGGGTESDQYGTTVTALTNSQESSNVLRSATTETIIPLNLTFGVVSGEHIGMFVKFDNVEFADDLAGERYFDPTEDYDTQRTLQSCSGLEYSELILETSAFSTFKNELLPTLNGSISGVIVKNFSGDTTLLTLNSTEDVVFENTRCSLLNIDDFNVVYEEDFEGFGNYTNEGWTNVNVSGTNTDWFISGFNNNDYSRISAFSSNNSEADVWLVTPVIDLGTSSDNLLSFDLEVAFSNGIILSAYISTDFSGDPLVATWEPLNAEIPYGSTTGFGGLQPITTIDISQYEGNVNIGFFYEGSDPDATTRYHLDNLKVLSN
ncbi:choice-of-anchor J domain-containing protein [Olleya sp. YSTF-M6]|uniref:Choice-of-anchor J domain-containing protein n=1 Tax=Olleya sediminilitoris TaxID=2795739 RepID=A0ABS1WGH8_9FLAO|nr:DUF5689 domain-containing protein [Olleya sediminilitoris]MBL7558228.1 choice-of-anchor J domain-containing protein [Olleya sediminilitoris]